MLPEITSTYYEKRTDAQLRAYRVLAEDYIRRHEKGGVMLPKDVSALIEYYEDLIVVCDEILESRERAFILSL